MRLKGAAYKVLAAVGAMGLGAVLVHAGAADQGFVLKKCLNCHSGYKAMKNIVAGEFQSRSNKAKSISVLTGKGEILLIKFTAKTKITNAPSVKKLKKPVPLLVTYQKVGSDLVAQSIKVKPVFKVPAKQLVTTKQMIKLAASGKALLVDSRPPAHFHAGHIPGAINVPFPKMKAMKARFPKDKNAVVVFYCQGFR